MNEHYVVQNDDVLYVTDSRKRVVKFCLNKLDIIGNEYFYNVYPKIKLFEKPKTEITYIKPAHMLINDFEDIQTNIKLSESISKITGLKFISLHDTTFHKYKLYRTKLSGYLNHYGKFEVETIETDEKLYKQRILEYIESTTFKSDFLPNEIEKHFYKYFFGGYRNANDSIAEVETKLDREKRKREFEERKTLDTINGIYIPINLKESIIHLDAMLNFEIKEKIKDSKNIWEFNSHTISLGMWIRNNWGINV